MVADLFISAPKTKFESGYTIISSEFHINDRKIDLWFKTKAVPLNIELAQDAFLVAVLIPSMKIGGTLSVDLPISQRLKNNISIIQNIYSKWDGNFKKINLEAKERSNKIIAERPISKSGAMFFSGGVNALYTLQKNLSRIDNLYYAHGFDIDLNYKSVSESMYNKIEMCSNKMSKNLSEIETNFHSFSREFVKWPNHYYGSAMASMAILLSARNNKFYFASRHTYSDLYPWGSHPLVDPLWNTEYVKIIHHGCEASRSEKIAYIAKDPRNLEVLSVGGASKRRMSWKYICTSIALDMAGIRNMRPEFGKAVSISDIENMEFRGHAQNSIITDLYMDLQKRSDKAEVCKAVSSALRKYHHKVLIGYLKQKT